MSGTTRPITSARLRPLIAPGLCTLLMGAFLIGLGVWQLHRLAWKDAIIARIEARTTAPAQPVPPASEWAGLQPGDYEYRHVTLTGTFDNDKETLVFRPSEDGPGYLVMTPLTQSDGAGTVLVDRGWVPDRLKDRAARAAGDATGVVRVTGLMRGPESRNIFTPADDLRSGQFFTRDPVEISARDGITAAPFTVDADATPNPGGWPRGGATVLAIPNNHFSYAMTWFGLALGLFGVFGSYAWKRVTSEPDTTPGPGPTRAEPRADFRATHRAMNEQAGS